MVIQMDWNAVLMGFAAGVLVSVLFFGGLAWGMQLALRSRRPGGLLLLSAACRIAMLLGIGFWITTSTQNAWPMAGYALAFFLVRLAAVFRARWTTVAARHEQKGA